MKFTLRSAKDFVDGYKKTDKLIEDGFVIQEDSGYIPNNCSTIEISTLEELFALAERYDCALVLDPSPPYSMTGEPEIIIYNGYLE